MKRSADDEKEAFFTAEINSARRLLHRFTSHIASSSSNPDLAEESRFFNLDESLTVDPERSLITPTSTHLSSSVGRTFTPDLLDDIESLRSTWEDYIRKTNFAASSRKLRYQRQCQD